MSSWIPGRQTTLGLAVLGIGTSFSFLFFYSPRPNLSPGFDARSLELHPRLGFSESPANPSEVPMVPMPTGTRWRVHRASGPESSGGEARDPGRMVSTSGKPVVQSLDELLLHAPAIEPIPKTYPEPNHKLSAPASRPNHESTRRTFDDMVPVATPRSNPQPAMLSEGTSRFGAGKYRPNIPPMPTPTPAPTPTLAPWSSSPPAAPIAQTVPLPSSTLPSPAVPSPAVPSSAVPSSAVPSPAVPSPAVPSSQLVTTSPMSGPANGIQAGPSHGTPAPPQGTSKDIFSRYEEKREPKFVRQPRSFR